jgi:dipeptidyl aminopeptidase/acylaminoacyl peptidase
MLQRLAIVFFLIGPIIAEKRPLAPGDYDSWRHIQNQTLSDDGHFLAYALFPQQGDGEIVIRDLQTDKEIREAAGELPPPPLPNYSNPPTEEALPTPPGIALKFTADSRFLIASTFASHDAIEAAKRARAAIARPNIESAPRRVTRNQIVPRANTPPRRNPKGDVVAINLASGAKFRAPSVKDFQLPSSSSDYLAYLQIPENPADTAAAPNTPSGSRKIETGDLVLRNLNEGAERRFPQVSEYSLTRDAKALVYAVNAHDGKENGVYQLAPGSDSNPVPLLSGTGTFNKLAWDQDQTRLAFLSNCGEGAGKRDDYTLYSWDRRSRTATEIASNRTPGFPPNWILSDRATLTVATGGNRIFFGTAPERSFKPIDPAIPEDERVSVDLWSWKDDYIQPMQKIQAVTERFRSYRAVYDLPSHKFLQIGTPSLSEIAPSEDAIYAIGEDDRAYRRMEEYDADYADSYLVDARTGNRKLVARRHVNHITWSPTSKYAIYFNGKDWITISTADGRAINLTSKLSVSFANEQNDTPGFAASYRLAGWTVDGRSVLIYDRYDIWQFNPDGSSAVNITQGEGRKQKLQFRVIRFETDDPASRWIDPTKPLLLRVENDFTHETGFYTMSMMSATAPKRLVLEPKNFTPPVKARNADVYVTAASTFNEYPDLLITDSTFGSFKKVSDANPQMAGLLWGTAELVRYNNVDGIPLQATLYKPENFDAKKKYPLLVYIYERLTQNVNNFIEPRPYNTINPSVYTSNGYLVLEPDIAYRVGFPGQSALDCVLPAVQAVVNQGFVDERAIGIQGHSWGGYQIAYMITRTNRFRAAAAGAPVSDMISAYDGIRWGPGIPRQFQYERTQSRIGGTVWEFPLRYIENSPIFAADRVNTPLLMIHNDADDAVPWYQGIEYFLALRRLNKEVYMFTYNGEPHNLRRRADQKDYSLRLQQFFDYYLKGAAEPDWMKNGIPYLDKPGVGASLSADNEP